MSNRLAVMNMVAFRVKSKLLVDFMRHKLARDQYWLEVAMRLLYERQTKDEKVIRTTIYKNMKGFNKPDALAIADVIVRYLLLGSLSGTDKALLQKILPKYADQLYNRSDKKIQDKLETELMDPITRAGYRIDPKDLRLVQDQGSYDRSHPLGETPEIQRRSPGRIILNKKIAKELVRVAKILISMDKVIAKNESHWGWEDDDNERIASVIMSPDGELFLEIWETHTKMGLGAGKRTTKLVGTGIGTVSKPNLGLVRSLLKKHGHNKTSAGGPFKAKWKDAYKQEKSLVDIINDQADLVSPESDEDKKRKILDYVSRLQGKVLDDLASFLRL